MVSVRKGASIQVSSCVHFYQYRMQWALYIIYIRVLIWVFDVFLTYHTMRINLTAMEFVLSRRKTIGWRMARNLSTLSKAMVNTLAATVTPESKENVHINDPNADPNYVVPLVSHFNAIFVFICSLMYMS